MRFNLIPARIVPARLFFFGGGYADLLRSQL